MTGDPGRIIPLIYNKKTGKPVFQSPNSFVAPACKACNHEFSALEGRAKTVITALLAGVPITEDGSSVLLDWLDKVRIGLWLTDMLRNPDYQFVKPRFHVAQRVGLKDRCVLMIVTDCNRKGLSISGTSSLSFHLRPSCFGLGINHLYFVNVSREHLFGHRLGFPVLVDRHYTNKWWLAGSLRKGTGKPKIPVFRREVPLEHLAMFQPCFSDQSPAMLEMIRDPAFASHRTYGIDGRAKVFSETGQLMFASGSSRKKIDFSSQQRYPREFLQLAIPLIVADIQDWMDDADLSTEMLNIERRQAVRQLVRAGRKSNANLIARRIAPKIVELSKSFDPELARAARKVLRVAEKYERRARRSEEQDRLPKRE